jgi:hypothetical protein
VKDSKIGETNCLELAKYCQQLKRKNNTLSRMDFEQMFTAEDASEENVEAVRKLFNVLDLNQNG